MSINSSNRLLQLVKQAEMQQKQADFLSLMRNLGRMTGQAGRAVGEKFNLGKAFFDKYRPNNVSSADWMKNKTKAEASMRAQGGTMPRNRFKDKGIHASIKPQVQNQNANIALSGLGGLGAGTALGYSSSPSSSPASSYGSLDRFNKPNSSNQVGAALRRLRDENSSTYGDGFSSFSKKSSAEKQANILGLLGLLAQGARLAYKRAPLTTGALAGYGVGNYRGRQESNARDIAAQKYINNLIERNNSNVDKMVKYEPLPTNWSSNYAPPKEMQSGLPPAAKSKGLIESLFGR
jgi:hypothetical protein